MINSFDEVHLRQKLNLTVNACIYISVRIPFHTYVSGKALIKQSHLIFREELTNVFKSTLTIFSFLFDEFSKVKYRCFHFRLKKFLNREAFGV